VGHFKLDGKGATLATDRPQRFLGLDVGNRRVGVAVSDELGLTAQPVLTLERKPNLREDLRSLARLARRFGVAGIVAGLPRHLSGEESPQAKKTRVFAGELGKLTGLPVHFCDERLTTREAHGILYAAGRARQAHRRVVDQVAAVLILQCFLDGRRCGEQGLEENGDSP
jgi:putative holliday junction resolvase